MRDPLRMDYLQKHLRAVREAIDQGCDIRGYMCWSLLDNLEWSLANTLRRQLDERGDATMMVYGDREITWRQMYTRAAQVAQALAAGYERVLCCAEVAEARRLRAEIDDAGAFWNDLHDYTQTASRLEALYTMPTGPERGQSGSK